MSGHLVGDRPGLGNIEAWPAWPPYRPLFGRFGALNRDQLSTVATQTFAIDGYKLLRLTIWAHHWLYLSTSQQQRQSGLWLSERFQYTVEPESEAGAMPDELGRIRARLAAWGGAWQLWLIELAAYLIGAASGHQPLSLEALSALALIIIIDPWLRLGRNWQRRGWDSLQTVALAAGAIAVLVVAGGWTFFAPAPLLACMAAWLILAAAHTWLEERLEVLLPLAAAVLGLVTAQATSLNLLALAVLGLWGAGWYGFIRRPSGVGPRVLWSLGAILALVITPWLSLILVGFTAAAQSAAVRRRKVSLSEQYRLLLIGLVWLLVLLRHPNNHPLTTGAALVLANGLAAAFLAYRPIWGRQLQRILTLGLWTTTIECLPELDWGSWQRAVKTDYRHAREAFQGGTLRLLPIISLLIVLLTPYYFLTRLTFLTSPLAPPLLFTALVLLLIGYAASGRRPAGLVIFYPLWLLGELGLLGACLWQSLGDRRSTPIKAPQQPA